MSIDGDPFADINWDSNTTDEQLDLSRSVDYQIGDLVPCSNEQAELVLKIDAMSEGKCFYRREQAFRTYDGKGLDPTDQPGMSRETLVCAILVTGFASGSFQYVDLAAESVTVRINWKASRIDEEQKFTGEFTPVLDRSGTASAGNGNTFAWSLIRSR
jgi:hypothetical protein